MTYWNTPTRHTAECHILERGPDGSHRLIHRAEPCAPAPRECLHIGAVGTCWACGTVTAHPFTLVSAV